MIEQHMPATGQDWDVLQTRVSVFHQEVDQVPSVGEWAREKYGKELDLIQSNPKDGSDRVFKRLSNGLLTIIGTLGRTDFIIEQAQEIEDISGNGQIASRPWANVSIGSYVEVVESAADPAKEWITKGVPVYRLAVGARLLLPGPGLYEVYQSLSRHIQGIPLDNVSSPDFVFRINRGRASQNDENIFINRLAAWSIGQGQIVTIPTGGGQPNASSIQFALHLELDINTRTTQDDNIPPGLSLVLLGELITLGSEIAQEGDVP